MRRNDDKGAIVVEATIALTAFVFLLYTLLSLVNICYIQAKMGVALNSAAKDISQYSYLYFKFGLGKAEGNLDDGASDYLNLGKDTVDGIGTFVGAMGGAGEAFESGDFDSTFENLQNGYDTAQSVYDEWADMVADDPKQFMIGLGRYAASEGYDYLKNKLGAAIAKSFMKKNLKAYKDDNPDRFLKKAGVVDGLSGLDFNGTAIFAGEGNEHDKIQLVVTYEVEVIKLLNIDFKFKFVQVARTKAWGTGISENKSSYSGIAQEWEALIPPLYECECPGGKSFDIYRGVCPAGGIA